MPASYLVLLLVLAFASPATPRDDSSVRRPPKLPAGVRLRVIPPDEIKLMFVESFGGMTVALTTKKGVWINARKMYVGDGTIAVTLEANNHGIWMQGSRRFSQADRFPRALIKVRKGYKRIEQLKPGELYVILRGVTFVEPGMLHGKWVGKDGQGQRVSLTLSADKQMELAIANQALKGKSEIGWYKSGTCHLDLQLEGGGMLRTIMRPGRQRLRLELNRPGADRPTRFTKQAVVLMRETPK